MQIRTLLISGTVALLLSSAVHAQEGELNGHSWDEALMGAFFTDEEEPQLLPEAEIARNWTELSQEQRDQVRTNCAAMGLDAATMEGQPPLGPTTGAPAEEAGPDAEEPTVEGVADQRISLSTWTRLCNFVDPL